MVLPTAKFWMASKFASERPWNRHFQFTSADAGVTAVPNSDSDFAAGYAEGKVLMSKRANACLLYTSRCV